jgi:hypothetical protein
MVVHQKALKYMGECDINITDDKVLNFIELLKGIDNSSREIMEEMFTKGDCGRFFFILKSVFPESEPYAITPNIEALDNGYIHHVITKIGDKYYDIRGVFDEERLHDLNDFVDKGWFESVFITTEHWLYECDLFNNYSYEVRGPIL